MFVVSFFFEAIHNNNENLSSFDFWRESFFWREKRAGFKNQAHFLNQARKKKEKLFFFFLLFKAGRAQAYNKIKVDFDITFNKVVDYNRAIYILLLYMCM